MTVPHDPDQPPSPEPSDEGAPSRDSSDPAPGRGLVPAGPGADDADTGNALVHRPWSPVPAGTPSGPYDVPEDEIEVIDPDETASADDEDVTDAEVADDEDVIDAEVTDVGGAEGIDDLSAGAEAPLAAPGGARDLPPAVPPAPAPAPAPPAPAPPAPAPPAPGGPAGPSGSATPGPGPGPKPSGRPAIPVALAAGAVVAVVVFLSVVALFGPDRAADPALAVPGLCDDLDVLLDQMSQQHENDGPASTELTGDYPTSSTHLDVARLTLTEMRLPTVDAAHAAFRTRALAACGEHGSAALLDGLPSEAAAVVAAADGTAVSLLATGTRVIVLEHPDASADQIELYVRELVDRWGPAVPAPDPAPQPEPEPDPDPSPEPDPEPAPEPDPAPDDDPAPLPGPEVATEPCPYRLEFTRYVTGQFLAEERTVGESRCRHITRTVVIVTQHAPGQRPEPTGIRTTGGHMIIEAEQGRLTVYDEVNGWAVQVIARNAYTDLVPIADSAIQDLADVHRSQ